MSRTRIKICGITTREAAFAAADAGADAVGFVFHPSSRRFIEPEDAFEIMVNLPMFVGSVGLFVNAPLEKFCQIEERCPTTWSQLHGHEDEGLVRECGPNLIKAVRYDEASIDDELALWNEIAEVDAILIDGSAGGQGVAFDWEALPPRLEKIDKRIILAGGLDPENVADAIRIVRPWAVDVSSGVEGSPGEKDHGLIHAFCDAVRAADAAG